MTFEEIFNMVGCTVKIYPNSISKIDSIVLRCATDIYIKQMEIEALTPKQVCGDNEHDYIEVNKKYLTKLEESKELEIYKKALELMAVHLQRFQDGKCFDHNGWVTYFINKARKEE